MEEGSDSTPDNSPPSPGNSMGSILYEHRTALAIVCVASLVLGVPLAGNMLWHTQGPDSIEKNYQRKNQHRHA